MSEYTAKSNVIWGSIDLSAYNAFAFYCNIFDRPDRDVDIISVPGRNGDIFFDNGRFENIDRVYQIQVTGVANAMDLVSELTKCMELGYMQLRDEYEDDIYMEARLKNPPVVDRFVGDSASFTLTFDRKPQKYFISDEEIFGRALSEKRDTYSQSVYYGKYLRVTEFEINNTSGQTARPIIRVWASGPAFKDFGVVMSDTRISGGTNFPAEKQAVFGRWNGLTFSNCFNIDCEKRTFYTDSPSYATQGDYFKCNNIGDYAGDYPYLKKGTSYVYVVLWNESPASGTFTDLYPSSIRPRWYKI